MRILCLVLAILPQMIFSQVGINTSSPQETLHVEGTMRVSDKSTATATTIVGSDNAGTLTDIVVGSNLELTGNQLNAIFPATSGSPAYYLVTDITIPDGSPGENFNDLDILLGSSNADKVVFRLLGRTSNYKITGISGGSDGRHIVLFNVSLSNLTVTNEDTKSLPQNRLVTLANNVATSGQGTAELVYDGTLQRWILIAFRD